MFLIFWTCVNLKLILKLREFIIFYVYKKKNFAVLKKVQLISSILYNNKNNFLNRLEERNKELENILEDTNNSIKTLQEEKGKEISSLNSQINSYTIRTEEYKNQLAALEKSRINDKFTHIEKTKNIDEKYNNKRLMLISQIKLLSNCFLIFHTISFNQICALYIYIFLIYRNFIV